MTACLVCDESLELATTVGTTGRHGEPVHTVACERCGLVQQTARPSDEELAAYYAGPYRELFVRDDIVDEHGVRHGWHSDYAQSALASASASYAGVVAQRLGLERGSRVLEVGCGDGHFAAALSKHAIVEAIDADESMVVEARSRGVDARRMTLSQLASEREAAFDAAVCLHVLEHVTSPILALRDMRSLVGDRGRLWLEVPDVDAPYGDLDTHYWQRPHIACFSAYTLWLALRRVGFRRIELARGDHVIYALAGDAGEELVYGDALADFERRTDQRLPSAAEVRDGLMAYQAKCAKERREDQAVKTMRSFLAGDDSVPLADLRQAFELVGEQSAVAARIAQAAIQDGVEMCARLDEAVSEIESYDEDDWVRGYRAGVASMAARASHMVGHAANRWMLQKVSAR